MGARFMQPDRDGKGLGGGFSAGFSAGFGGDFGGHERNSPALVSVTIRSASTRLAPTMPGKHIGVASSPAGQPPWGTKSRIAAGFPACLVYLTPTAVCAGGLDAKR